VLEAIYQDLPSGMMRGGGKEAIWPQQLVFLLIFILSLLSSVFELGLSKFKVSYNFVSLLNLVLNHLISICLVAF
jgi:hypothetical protein